VDLGGTMMPRTCGEASRSLESSRPGAVMSPIGGRGSLAAGSPLLDQQVERYCEPSYRRCPVRVDVSSALYPTRSAVSRKRGQVLRQREPCEQARIDESGDRSDQSAVNVSTLIANG
jgi:hypothetical protein